MRTKFDLNSAHARASEHPRTARSPLTRGRAGAFSVALILTAILGGCSDIYFDRRETVSLHANDAAAANKAAQVIDPWPAAAANRRIETNGERMAHAAERYRAGKTTPLSTSAPAVQPVIVPVAPPVAAPAPAQ